MSMTENDILLNLTTVLTWHHFEVDYEQISLIAKSCIRHCIITNFDIQSKQALLLNSFYLLVKLSFESYSAEALSDLIF